MYTRAKKHNCFRGLVFLTTSSSWSGPDSPKKSHNPLNEMKTSYYFIKESEETQATDSSNAVIHLLLCL